MEARRAMRLFVWIGVSLVCCELWCVPGVGAGFTQVAFDNTDLSCTDHEDGVPFPSKDGCHECTCLNGNRMRCTYAICPTVYCHKEMVINEPGKCCPICRPGCFTDNFGYMEVGQSVAPDKCTDCTCAADGRVYCKTYDCLPCEGGHWEADDTCCGKCDLTKCNAKGGIYNNGDVIPNDDPCRTCSCVADGSQVEIKCAIMACAMCLGIHKDDGTCCGSCEIPDCNYKGTLFKLGERMPEEDPCATCSCELIEDYRAERVCMMFSCMPCQGKYVNDGSCCGKCIPQCEVRGQLFDIGTEVLTSDPCETCRCMSVDGQPEVKCISIACDIRCPKDFEHVSDDSSCCGHCEPILTPVCDPEQCPKVRCRKSRRFQLPGMCCPLCKCKYKGKMVDPGPFGDKCDGCVCDGFGKVTCKPVVCLRKESLQCVDAVKGEDCCYHCPNGKTCAHPKNHELVIKYGEYKKVKNTYCTCAGEPWFPNAFCSWERTRSLRKLKRKYGDRLAEYMILE